MARSVAAAKLMMLDRERLRQIFGWMVSGQSLISAQPLVGNARFSAEEFQLLSFVTAPLCDQCGLPFAQPEDAGLICGACAASPPLWDRARAPFAYDDVSSRLILALKRGGRRNGLTLFAHFMSESARDLLETGDILVPVPVHYRRLVQRGFNQAGWLAEAIGDYMSMPVAHSLLRRVKATPSQGRYSARQRKANVAGAFALTPAGRQRLRGKRVVLIDDVYTTGATLNACARALRQAKPANIDVVTLARVVAPKNPLI